MPYPIRQAHRFRDDHLVDSSGSRRVQRHPTSSAPLPGNYFTTFLTKSQVCVFCSPVYHFRPIFDYSSFGLGYSNLRRWKCYVIHEKKT
jgi:hypothetical protein